MSDPQLELKKLEKELIVHEVDRMLIAICGEAGVEAVRSGNTVDTLPTARRIVAYLREHLVD